MNRYTANGPFESNSFHWDVCSTNSSPWCKLTSKLISTCVAEWWVLLPRKRCLTQVVAVHGQCNCQVWPIRSHWQRIPSSTGPSPHWQPWKEHIRCEWFGKSTSSYREGICLQIIMGMGGTWALRCSVERLAVAAGTRSSLIIKCCFVFLVI